MKQLYLLLISVVCSLVLVSEVKGQCVYDPTVTLINVNLTAKANTVWTINANALNISRNDGACGDNNCIVFVVSINPGTTEVGFNVQNPAPTGMSAFYQLD